MVMISWVWFVGWVITRFVFLCLECAGIKKDYYTERSCYYNLNGPSACIVITSKIAFALTTLGILFEI